MGRAQRSGFTARIAIAFALAAATLLGSLGSTVRADEPPRARPIPSWFGQNQVPHYSGAPHTPNPIIAPSPPAHPFMADHGGNNMHADSYATGTYEQSGPLGENPRVTSAAYAPIGGLCAGHAFDAQGRIVTVCGGFSEFTLRLLDPGTLGAYAEKVLPNRPTTLQALLTGDLQKIFTDTSGGAYFYLDNQDRVVLVDARQRLRIIGIDESSGSPRWEDVESIPLEPYLQKRDCFEFPTNMFPSGRCDAVTAVLPDWDGYYWWVSREGLIGTVHPQTFEVKVLDLGEEIQNSFAVDANGVYIVSDFAMYGFRRGADGTPEPVWREEYERATRPRPGQINLGSGTTPALVGADLVAITDGADPINVIYMDRRATPSGPRTKCEVPVFDEGRSAGDNSLVAVGNSVIVENNYGYENFLTLLFGGLTPGGLARVDISTDRSSCGIVWESAERSPSTVPKVSKGNGLLYVYTKDPAPPPIDAWYFTAIDFHTGETAWKRLTGTGWNFDNLWAATTVGPDGTAYTGVFNGLIAVRDTGP